MAWESLEKSSPNSAGFLGVGSGGEFELRFVMAPLKYVLGKFWIWAGGVLYNGGGGGRCT